MWCYTRISQGLNTITGTSWRWKCWSKLECKYTVKNNADGSSYQKWNMDKCWTDGTVTQLSGAMTFGKMEKF